MAKSLEIRLRPKISSKFNLKPQNNCHLYWTISTEIGSQNSLPNDKSFEIDTFLQNLMVQSFDYLGISAQNFIPDANVFQSPITQNKHLPKSRKIFSQYLDLGFESSKKAHFTHLVFKPRPKSPIMPSLSTTKRTVSMYEIVEG